MYKRNRRAARDSRIDLTTKLGTRAFLSNIGTHPRSSPLLPGQKQNTIANDSPWRFRHNVFIIVIKYVSACHCTVLQYVHSLPVTKDICTQHIALIKRGFSYLRPLCRQGNRVLLTRCLKTPPSVYKSTAIPSVNEHNSSHSFSYTYRRQNKVRRRRSRYSRYAFEFARGLWWYP